MRGLLQGVATVGIVAGMDAKTLAEAMPGLPLARATLWAQPVTDAMQEFGVVAAEQQAAFLAQVGHESGSFRFVREIWGPTPAQLRYEGRLDLGNVHPGDGSLYRGRGLLQITGRANYALVGHALDADLIGHPELLETPILAARSAGWYWEHHGLNRYVADFVTLTRRINGGTNGLDDRTSRWTAAKRALGV